MKSLSSESSETRGAAVRPAVVVESTTRRGEATRALLVEERSSCEPLSRAGVGEAAGMAPGAGVERRLGLHREGERQLRFLQQLRLERT